MSHPADGVLRQLVDEPVDPADARHVGACDPCTDRLAEIRHDAALVEAALAIDIGAIDIDAAWQRHIGGDRVASLPAAAPGAAPGSGPPPAGADVLPLRPRTARARRALRRPILAGAAVAVVVAGAGAAAASDWFEIFRTERITPITISASDLNELPDLSSYGELDVSGEPDVHRVADAEAAEAETGLEVPEVADLPSGVIGEPTYQVGDDVTATFTFSEAAAAEAAEDAGEDLPALPPELDGTEVRLTAGPGVAQLWRTESGLPGLLVGRAVAPTGSSSSAVSFEELRDRLVGLPGMPDEVADALRAFNADGGTLPLPVPEDGVSTSSTTVAGQPATVLTTDDRTMAAVVWVEDGVVTVVAGPLDAGEVVAVARGLR